MTEIQPLHSLHPKTSPEVMYSLPNEAIKAPTLNLICTSLWKFILHIQKPQGLGWYWADIRWSAVIFKWGSVEPTSLPKSWQRIYLCTKLRAIKIETFLATMCRSKPDTKNTWSQYLTRKSRNCYYSKRTPRQYRRESK